MKIYWPIFLFVFFLASCKTSDRKISESEQNIKPVPEIDSAKRRQLIEALYNLNFILKADNKKQISQIFSLPVATSDLAIYPDDDSFYIETKQNGDSITQDIFSKHLISIYAALPINDIITFFSIADLSILMLSDTIILSNFKVAEPCFVNYSLVLENENISLRIEKQTKEHYRPMNKSEKDNPMTSSEYCEHMIWLTFILDGKKLVLKHMNGAG